jgi:type II secretory pathway pseudopilin PulG
MVLLAVLAILGASMAVVGTAWTTATQRERETELQFRGGQIRDAIGRYRASVQPAAWPSTLEDLLEDRRGLQVRHHLRRVWADPFTRRVDWVLVYASEGEAGSANRHLTGVRSRSNAPRMSLAGARAADPKDPRVSDWLFDASAPPSPPPAAAAASGPSS